ncbi:PrsW family glutamic-type intramembrane protease [Treponema sp.]|uniref:PrsW family glutamic-type intramembrane protease n=1 Tax=Treponema sp. TaxID=166 RepID=UPI00388EA9CB
MNLYALLGISFIPSIVFFTLAVFLNQNLKIKYCVLSCILALITVIPTSLIQFYVLSLPIFNGYTFASVMITAVLFNGLIEESMKMLFMCMIPQKKQILSSFFCSVVLYGLVTGGFESVIYIVNKFQEIQGQGGKEIVVQLLLNRIFSAQAIHLFCAGLSGLYIWNFRHQKKNPVPFIYAVLLHGIYNFFISFSSMYRWLAIIAILFAAVECRIFYVSAKKDSLENNV